MADLIFEAKQTLLHIEKRVTKYDTKEIVNADFTEDNVLQLEIDQEKEKLKIYYININEDKQEIWVSSPISGPMQFCYFENSWINKKSNIRLIDLLAEELKQFIPNLIL